MKMKQEVLSKIAYSCFYVGVVIEVLLVLIDKSAYTNPIEGQIFRLTFLLFLVKVCLTKYSKKEYFTIFVFCLLGAISYFVTERNEVIRLVMFIAACKNIDMKKCLKTVFYLTLIGSALIVFMSVTGIYGAISLTQDYGRGGVETRYTLGMGHPNALQCMVWALTTLGLFLYAESMRWYHYLVAAAISAFFFFLTDSKTSLLVAFFVIILTYILNIKKSEIASLLGAVVAIVTTIFSIVISVVIAGNAYRVYNYVWHDDFTPITMFFVKLNNILNGRIRILVENDTFEGTIQTWSLFSRPENDRYFDMGWIRLFYWYGIIPACVFIIALLLAMFYCYKRKHYMGLMMIASFALYTVIEAHGISVYLARNYVFFLLGQYWWQILSRGNEKEGKLI